MPTFLDNEDSLSDPEALSAEVMEDAATHDGENPAPEVSRYTAGITAWDEPPHVAGHQSSKWPVESEETEAEKLVRADNEEAAREQRAATEVIDGDYPTD